MTSSKQQAALFVDRETALWDAWEKVRLGGQPSVDQLALLDEVLRANAPVRADDVRYLCAVWRAEFQKATGASSPRLTPTEVHALKDATRRVGGPGELVRLMPAFFAWRHWLVEQKAAAPQPTTVGFIKHLASLQEFAAKMTRKGGAAKLVAERRAAQKAAEEAPSVVPEEVRRFRTQLERGVRMTDAQLNDRHQKLQDQVEELRQKEAR